MKNKIQVVLQDKLYPNSSIAIAIAYNKYHIDAQNLFIKLCMP